MKTLLLALTVCLALGAALLAADAAATKTEVLANFADANKKIVALAEAMPAGSYGWRPMEGVRSVSETYMHIAGANYLFGGMLGAPTPEGVDAGSLEKTVTSKEDCVAALKASIDYATEALEGIDDFDAAMKLFGRDSTKFGGALIIVTHAHEHLGQAIAYARTNKVVPPWSK
jgi:uncharacterized damage-inducible protein DinB